MTAVAVKLLTFSHIEIHLLLEAKKQGQQLVICKCCPILPTHWSHPLSQVVACCMIWQLFLVIVGDHPSFTRKWPRVSMKMRTFYPRHELTSAPFNASIAQHWGGPRYIEVHWVTLRYTTGTHCKPALYQWMKGPVIGRTESRGSLVVFSGKAFVLQFLPKTQLLSFR